MPYFRDKKGRFATPLNSVSVWQRGRKKPLARYPKGKVPEKYRKPKKKDKQLKLDGAREPTVIKNVFVEFDVDVSEESKSYVAGKRKNKKAGRKRFFHGFLFKRNYTEKEIRKEFKEGGKLMQEIKNVLPEYVTFQKINKLVFNSKGLKGRVEGKLSPRSGFKYLKSR